MIEPPNISNETIVASIQAHYGIPVATLTFLPIGHDSSAWVYRVRAADGTAYFLKIRKGEINEPALVIPRYLQDHGLAQILAPFPTTNRTPWAGLGDFALILYPFLEGHTGMEVGMSERQWIDYGAILRQLHATALTPELAQLVRCETFQPKWAGMITRIDAYIDGTLADPAERELAAFWQARRDEIRTITRRAQVFGEQLRQANPALVLCHADVHTGNVMLDADQQVWIVDWDEITLAPKERDLMFVVGGISSKLVGPREEGWFFQGYGEAMIDRLALAYYRYAWAVGDIGSFAEQVLLMPDVGAETKREGLRYFMGLFQPGEIVDLAYRSFESEIV